MKRVLPVLLIIVSLSYFSSCEKDDICVEGDTPLLYIGFYDFEDTLSFKRVPSIRIRAVNNTGINDSTLVNSTFSDRSSSPDSLGVPLIINGSSTSFEFITNSADDDDGVENGMIDTLTFNYTVNPEYISRPCGFIANFNELDTLRQVFSSDWIKRISIVNSDIERPNQIHVKIFH